MQDLYDLIDHERAGLSSKIILYAKIHNYTSCAPTLEDTWKAAVNGIADAFLFALAKRWDIPELDCFDDYAHDPLSAYGIVIAKKHRYLGVSLEIILGILKYFRRAFQDLILEQQYEVTKERKYCSMMNRFFDRVEIGFCLEWTREKKDDLVEELQIANRELAFEKNKYVNIFESTPNPVALLNQQHCVEHLNRAARELILPWDAKQQYANQSDGQLSGVEQVMPWLSEEFFSFIGGYESELNIEKDILLGDQGKRSLEIKIIKLSDNVRQLGTVIILTDLTERKNAEASLRYMSFHDGLTGLYNRSYFEQEMQRLENGRFDPVGIISFDVDGLKLVNDALGHQAGDRLLIATGNVIHDCFRGNDVVARIGGDEFAVLLPNSPAEVVERAAQRMREAVELHNQANPRIPLSISQGWAVRTDLSENLSKIYREADYQMYREKPWNREEFHQRFFRLYKEYGNDLYHVNISSKK